MSEHPVTSELLRLSLILHKVRRVCREEVQSSPTNLQPKEGARDE